MSRCFPFPPPGFEKKVVNDHRVETLKTLQKYRNFEAADRLEWLCGPTDVRVSNDGIHEKVTFTKSGGKVGASPEKDRNKMKEVRYLNKRTADQMFDSQVQDHPKNGVQDKNNKRKNSSTYKERESRKERVNSKNETESDGSLKIKKPGIFSSHDYDTQPNKLSRTDTTLVDVRNISNSSFFSVLPRQTCDSNGTLNAASPAEKIVLMDSIVSSVTYVHPSADESDACEVSTRLAGNDSHCLRQIYSVPEEMEEMSDTDVQEWLFRKNMVGLKADSKYKSEEITVTWDRAVWNETTGVITFPYVIPY